MPSTATTRNRLEKQGVGENANTWGTKLNTDLDLLDDALDGVTAFALSGSKTLSNTDYAADEARCRVIDVISGTGGTVTIPNVQKAYLVRNASTGNVTFTTGSGTTATVPTLTSTWVFSSGSNVIRSIDTTDVWTYKRVTADFTHANTTPTFVTGIGVNASEVQTNGEYEYEGIFYLKISSGSLIARWIWMGGMHEAVGEIRCNTGTAEVIVAGSFSPVFFDTAAINPGSAYRPMFVKGTFNPSSSKNGDMALSVYTSTGTPTITVRAGSFIRFRRTYP